MSSVDIYTKIMCPYCTRAKSLLKKKGVAFREIDVTFDRAGQDEMRTRANGGRTVPQIFIGDTHVGGCDELMALERDNKLDGLLGAAPAV